MRDIDCLIRLVKNAQTIADETGKRTFICKRGESTNIYREYTGGEIIEICNPRKKNELIRTFE